MENIFTKIYEKNIWSKGSGKGSSLKYNKQYIDFLTEFMNELNIKKVLDIGCGDWQFSQHINWSDIDYIGIDCVNSVVNSNNLKFATENIKFLHLDPTLDSEYENLPKNCDLVILKDILQHWNNEEIISFMDKLTSENHKYILIVNNYKDSKNENRDINNRYHYAKIDAKKYPLNKYKPLVILKYKFKQVSIISK